METILYFAWQEAGKVNNLDTCTAHAYTHKVKTLTHTPYIGRIHAEVHARILKNQSSESGPEVEHTVFHALSLTVSHTYTQSVS